MTHIYRQTKYILQKNCPQMSFPGCRKAPKILLPLLKGSHRLLNWQIQITRVSWVGQSTRPNIAIFCTFCPMPDQKTMWTRCLGGFSVMWITKLMISQVKKKVFLPKNDQIWPKIGISGQFGPGHAGLFGALLVGWLVVVARGLYLARHLFTL